MTVRGLKTNYIDMGRGEPLLFLHGWGAPADSYLPLLTHLSRRFRVLAPDLPGFGGTEEPQNPWYTDDYVDFAQTFLVTLGIDACTMVGHSHGGRMLLNWLSRDENTISVKKAVLIAAAGLRPPRSAHYYLKIYSYKLGKLVLTPFPALKKRFAARSGSDDYRAASPIMRTTLSQVVNEDYSERLKLINAEVLLIFGDLDTATPLVANGRRMEAEIPRAGLAVLHGATHWGILEQCPLVCRILDVFL
ncbi:alpha/beta hydrolase [Clostridia bacterium]|nr:alpha/beta hydrolase [Clostridia bacterium]